MSSSSTENDNENRDGRDHGNENRNGNENGNDSSNENSNENNPENGEENKSKFEKFLDKMTNSAKDYMSNSLKNITGYLKAGASAMDLYTKAASGIESINDGSQSSKELQDKVFASSKRTKIPFAESAQAMTNMGMAAGGAFKSNDEMIGFTELSQKSLKLGNTSSDNQNSVMEQLTQSMGAGSVNEDAFGAIVSSAPMMLSALEQYTGKGREELSKMAEKGLITADIMKNAMFSMSDGINSKFADLPITWADIITRLQDDAVRALAPLMDSIQQLMQSDGFQQFIDMIAGGFYVIGAVASAVVNEISSNWTWISALLTGALIVGMAVLIAYLWASLAPIGAMIAGFTTMALQFLMMHAPLFAAIAIVSMLAYVFGQMGGTAADVVGFIAGVFSLLFTTLVNQVIFIWNIFAAFSNFLANLFQNPLAAIRILFYDFTIAILGFIEQLASGLETLVNKIPTVEVDLTSGISNLKNDFMNRSKTIKEQANLTDTYEKMDYLSGKDAYNGGYDAGKGLAQDIEKKLKGLGKNSQNKDLSMSNPADAYTNTKPPFVPSSQKGTDQGFYQPDAQKNQRNGLGSLETNGPVKVEGTSKNGAVSVDIQEEDIQYLRDVAERDFMAQIQHKTLAPNISVRFSGPISKEVDTDKMYRRISKILAEEIAVAGEG